MKHLEESLHALSDYLCSYSIKNTNRSIINQGMLLAMGGKAFNAYIRTPYREDSYDWDCSLYKPEGSTISIEDVLKNIANDMNHLITYYMPVAHVTVYNAIKKNKVIDGVNLQLISVKYNSRMSFISNISVHTIDLYYGAYKLYSLIESATEKIIPNDKYQQLLSMSNCMSSSMSHMLTTKFYMISRSDLLENLNSLIAPESSYPKKDKAVSRLRILNDALQNPQKLMPYVGQAQQEILQDIVFDATGRDPVFQPNALSPTNEAAFATQINLIQNNSDKYGPVKQYTGNYSINTALLKKFYLKDTLSANEQRTVSNLDASFNFFDQTIKQFDTPITLYRHTRYIDPPINKGSKLDPNLYMLKPGDILPNIGYTSTAYTNQANLTAFIPESQFKGCLFIIQAYSTEGLIFIGVDSYFPYEKEILLHRNGSLHVTKVEYKFLIEKCGDLNTYPERLTVYADYVPGSATNHKPIPKSIYVPETDFTEPTRRYDRETDFTEPTRRYDRETTDEYVTEWGARVRRDDKMAKISKSSCAWQAITINYLWDSYDDDGGASVNTAFGVVNTTPNIIEFLDMKKYQIPQMKTQGVISRLSNMLFGERTVEFAGAGQSDYSKLILMIILIILTITVIYYVSSTLSSSIWPLPENMTNSSISPHNTA